MVNYIYFSNIFVNATLLLVSNPILQYLHHISKNIQSGAKFGSLFGPNLGPKEQFFINNVYFWLHI